MKAQSVCCKLAAHRLTLRIANCHSILVMVIGNIIRFAYFGPKEVPVEHLDSKGNSYVAIEVVSVTFEFVVTSIFVMPPMITLFILSEFQVKPHYIAKYFNFLDNPIGKGLWLIMVGLMFTEITNITEAILCVILAVLGLFNIALGIAYLAFQNKPAHL